MAGTRVTLDDVAEASEASSAAVSLALRNKPGVSRETRERILATARDLGYQRPQRAARDGQPALRNVALVIRTWDQGPERSSPALSPFYSWVLTGIQETAARTRMNVLLGTIPVDDANRPVDLSRQLLEQPLDGVLLVGSHRPETVDAVLEALQEPRAPMVLVDSDARGQDLDTVATDNYRGAYEAASELISEGHRRISYVGPVSTWEPNFRERRDGFRQALADHGLEPVKVAEIDMFAIGADERGALLSGSTATICGNDEHALVLMRSAARQGLRIPDDLSLIGFDDTTGARHAQPPLTTMAVDKVTMGRMAVQLLDHRIAWPDAASIHVSMTSRLVRRESVRTSLPGATA